MKIKKGGFLTIVITVLILIVLAYPVYAKTAPEGYTVLGKGNTCAYYIDNDADGYGVASPNGPDADDNDPAINTPQSVLAHYDANQNGKLDNVELKLFLKEHKGYDVKNIYYYSPTGSDATGEVNNPDKPYGFVNYGERPWDDWTNFLSQVQPGDAVIFREGRFKKLTSDGHGFSLDLSEDGTEENPLFIMAYPGEKAVIDYSTSITGENVSNVVIDGLVLNNSVLPGEGKGVDGHYWTDVILRNLEVSNYWVGMGPGPDVNVIFENNVIHDNGAHGIYLGSNELSYPGKNITIRGNVIYHNGYHGFQHNGRVTNMLIEDNIIHSNKLAGISLIMGVSYSTVRNNLIFNNNKQGIIFWNDPGSSGVQPYDQMYNLIESNTIWVGKNNWNGSGTTVSEHGAIVLNNTGDISWGVRYFDYNTFRNNILVTYNGPTFWFYQQDYADTTTIENNLIYKLGTDSTILRYGSANYNMAGFDAFNPLFRNNQFADPKFTDVSIDYYATPEKFNLDLLSVSPAIDAGTSIGVPLTDLRGVVRPQGEGFDIGAYEYVSGAPPVIAYGDVSGNGEISAADASLAAQYAVGLIDLTQDQVLKADVSGNGEVSAADASLIAQKAVGLIDKFPVEN